MTQQGPSTAMTPVSQAPIGAVRPPATLVDRAGRLYPTQDEWTAIMGAAAEMWKSGIAQDMGFKTQSAIVTVALKGWELGVGLMASAEGINVIEGRPRPNGAFLEFLGARVGGWVEWVKIGRDGTAECIAYRPGKKPVRGIFTTEDARQAELLGKNTYRKYPADMLCKRALSRATWKQFGDLYFGHVPPTNEVLADDMAITDEADVVDNDGPPQGDLEAAPQATASAAPPNGSTTKKSTRKAAASSAPAAPAATTSAPAADPSASAPPAASSPPPATTGAAPAPETAAAPPVSPPAAAGVPAAAPTGPATPEDKLLPYDKGSFAGKKLSDLQEKDFRQMIPGYRAAIANPNITDERKQGHREWLERTEAWAKYRNIDVPQ